MSTTVIPKQVVVTCDCCLKTCGNKPGNVPRKCDSVLKYIGAALDLNGDPACNADWTFDLCDSCHERIGRAITDCVDQIRKA